MKLIFLVLTVFIIGACEGRFAKSLSIRIMNMLSNKTAQFTDYMISKGHSIKEFYDNMFSFDLKWPTTSNGVDNNHDYISNEKFKNYLDAAYEYYHKNIEEPEISRYKYTEDPIIHMTTPQLITSNGYKAESHTIITDDGYILTVHRIPYSKNDPTKKIQSKTALLHHGLLGSSADWVLAGPKKGLGYILSDAGYDVWIANARGNTYSRAHVSLNTDTFEFWNFTFHEMSQHDLPAVIDYIMEIKNSKVKIDYIGHSMGTTILFALLSTNAKYNKILRAGYALAPVAYMTNIRSPIRLLAKYSEDLDYLLKLLGANEFLPQSSVLRMLSERACEINHWEEVICENSLFVICGHDPRQFNMSLLPIILGHSPSGTSTKTLVHYAQEINTGGRFQQFDYGLEGNFKHYGTATPPEYPLHKITLPIALFGAENDWLASDQDVSNLYVKLIRPIEHYIVPFKDFNHIDFLFAIDAPKLVYKRLLELMGQRFRNLYVYTDPKVLISK